MGEMKQLLFKSILDIEKHFEIIQELNHALLSELVALNVMNYSAIEIKSKSRTVYEEGELARSIHDDREFAYPEIVELDEVCKETLLRHLILPKDPHDQQGNVPSKVGGFIQLEVTEEKKEELISSINTLNRLREEMKLGIPVFEPSRSRRAKVIKKVVKGCLYQTVYRQIPIAPDNLRSVHLSWCRNQLSAVKQDANAWIEKIETDPRFTEETKKLYARQLKEAKNVHQIGFVRPHVEMTASYLNDGETTQSRRFYKAHSPLLVLSTERNFVEFKSISNVDHLTTRTPIDTDKYRPILNHSKFSLVEIVNLKSRNAS